jgi:Peptidase family M23
MRRFLAVFAVAALAHVPAAAAWSWPVEGPVLRPFVFGDDPYAAGQHRGIDIGAPDGTPVRAAVGGTVSFAGTVPNGGRTVTVQTAGGLSVTYLELGATHVTRGADVAEGDPIGTIGSAAHVHFGIRVTADPQGYLDPLQFLPARAAPVPEAQPESAAEASPVRDPVPASDAPLVTAQPSADPVAAEPEAISGLDSAVGAPSAPVHPASSKTSASEPEPAAERLPVLEPVPAPESSPTVAPAPLEPAVSEPGRQPEAEPEPAPSPLPVVEPIPTPEPSPTAAPVSLEPAASEPERRPEAEPASEPVPVLEPLPASEPSPTVAPVPLEPVASEPGRQPAAEPLPAEPEATADRDSAAGVPSASAEPATSEASVAEPEPVVEPLQVLEPLPAPEPSRTVRPVPLEPASEPGRQPQAEPPSEPVPVLEPLPASEPSPIAARVSLEPAASEPERRPEAEPEARPVVDSPPTVGTGANAAPASEEEPATELEPAPRPSPMPGPVSVAVPGGGPIPVERAAPEQAPGAVVEPPRPASAAQAVPSVVAAAARSVSEPEPAAEPSPRPGPVPTEPVLAQPEEPSPGDAVSSAAVAVPLVEAAPADNRAAEPDRALPVSDIAVPAAERTAEAATSTVVTTDAVGAGMAAGVNEAFAASEPAATTASTQAALPLAPDGASVQPVSEALPRAPAAEAAVLEWMLAASLPAADVVTPRSGRAVLDRTAAPPTAPASTVVPRSTPALSKPLGETLAPVPRPDVVTAAAPEKRVRRASAGVPPRERTVVPPVAAPTPTQNDDVDVADLAPVALAGLLLLGLLVAAATNLVRRRRRPRAKAEPSALTESTTCRLGRTRAPRLLHDCTRPSDPAWFPAAARTRRLPRARPLPRPRRRVQASIGA